jgi:pyruvate formate lyase activating enzyme
MTVGDVMEVIRKDAAFYRKSGGGVTLSGGEPLLYPDFCRELAESCRSEGFSVLLDTAASVDAGVLCGLLPHLDHCYIDLKAADKAGYAAIGGDFDRVVKNMKQLADSGVKATVRVPVIPGFNDTPDCAKRLAGVIWASGLRTVGLLPFHRLGGGKYAALSLPYVYSETEPPSNQVMRELAAVFAAARLHTEAQVQE